jgi:hypothetical protein
MKMRAIIGTSILALVAVLCFLPSSGAVSSSDAGSLATTACKVGWSSSPSGTYIPGANVAASVVTTCGGNGSWIIVSEPTGAVVAQGKYSCPSNGCETTLFSYTAGNSPIPKGSYQFAADFNGAGYTYSYVVRDFGVS